MIREDYDLDEVCYFNNDDTGLGETLEEIHDNVAALLEAEYQVERKRSVLRLKTKKGKDLKIDIVPGRYVSDDGTDVSIHQNEGDKERLKTNLEVHIAHVRDSGCTNVIQLGKLWRTRNGILIRTFPLELLIIEVVTSPHWRRGLAQYLVKFQFVKGSPRLQSTGILAIRKMRFIPLQLIAQDGEQCDEDPKIDDRLDVLGDGTLACSLACRLYGYR